MNKLVKWSQIFLLVLIMLGAVSSANAQDLFREMEQVKSDLSNLRDEVTRLRGIVYELRESVLKSLPSQEPRPAEQRASKKEKGVQREIPVNEEELTKTICQSVGKFFEEVEASLRGSDPAVAQERMRLAFGDLNSMLQKYSGTHRVSKLLSIYQGLAWDTYVAVELRKSVQGNEDFMKAIEKHKRKYIETCPKY